MYPTLKENDILFLQGADRANIKVGDLVVFGRKKKLVCHRVVGRKLDKGRMVYREKGDNSLISSGLAVDDVVGKVKEIYRGKQYISPSNYRLIIISVLVDFLFRASCFCDRMKRRVFPGGKLVFLSWLLRGASRKLNLLVKGFPLNLSK